ncbi:MAG TPA: hypothetical protein VHG91_04070 [Longimicrobium sp.]|nr:hypothetical protein [Longimicrobium sp.]
MRKVLPALVLGAGLLSACGSSLPLRVPGDPRDVVVVDDEREGRGGGESGARRLGVPRGHYPPPGECRVWHPGRPPGQQPPPSRCDRLVGRVPYGAFVLYNGKEWDTRYDWRTHERRNRGSVPRAILDLLPR